MHLKKFLTVLLDGGLFFLAFLAGLFMYQRGSMAGNLEHWWQYILLYVAIKLIFYLLGSVYHVLWRFATMRDLWHIVLLNLLGGLLTMGLNRFLHTGMPYGLFIPVFIFDTAFVGASRLVARAFDHEPRSKRPVRRTMIVGAGEAGNLVVEEIRRHAKLDMEPVVFIDDDEEKKNHTVSGVPVLGNRYDIERIAKQYDITEIIVALPSAPEEARAEILRIAGNTGANIRTVPGLFELIDGNIRLSDLKDVRVEDLLGRHTVDLDHRGVRECVGGNVVLVTGGGGSIGSELARQIAAYEPKKLILLDIYENGVYDIEQELRARHKDLNLRIVIDSIRNAERMERIFREEKPDVVFHAAAHKHVPLMEANPVSAVLNNVFGTRNVIRAAKHVGVRKFVQISTDKAVNPTNIMGATKRICEKLIIDANKDGKTDCVAVRFGNVLGSAGSVIPLFKRQIEAGGPVTVTDEHIIRYFMTIEEACQLVLVAAAMAKGGEIFVLDMGEPVRIMDLARNLIRLSGKKIDIEITGLRPGEKLYEEMLIDKSRVEETMSEKIFVEKPEPVDRDELQAGLEVLARAADTGNEEEIRRAIRTLVPGYHHEEHH